MDQPASLNARQENKHMMLIALFALAMVSVGSVLRAKRRTIGGLVWSSLGAGLFVGVTAVACVPGCAATPRKVASVSIVATGRAVQELVREHEELYTRETDRVRAEVLAEGGTVADYDRAVEPLNAEAEARARALGVASAALYGAAEVIDAARDNDGDTPAILREAAIAVLGALTDALDVLGEGDALPPVKIPLAVRTVTIRLTTLAANKDAGAPHDN